MSAAELLTAAQQAIRSRDPQEQAQVREQLEAYLEAEPEDAEACFHLALLLQRAGMVGRAAAVVHPAVRSNPKIPKYAVLLGDLLVTVGRPRDAIAPYQSALHANGKDPHTYCKIGECFRADGDSDNALDAFRAAVAHKPTMGAAWFGLAQTLFEAGCLGEAASALHRVLARQPRNGGAYVELGRIALARGHLDEASRCFQTALAVPSPMIENRGAIGHLFARLGDEEQAINAYQSVFDQQPDNPDALEGMAFLLRGRLSEEHAARIDALLERPELDTHTKARMHFSKVEQFGSDHREEQIMHAQKANQYQQRTWVKERRPHSSKAHSRMIDTLIETFDQDYFAERTKHGVGSTRPVFIIGMPRSGTSLLEQVLCSHEHVFGAGELMHVGRGLERLRRHLGADGHFTEAAQRADRFTTQQLAHDYLHCLSELDATATRVIDKMPLNFMNVGWIHSMFPNATIIHSCRDARDVALSCYLKGLAKVRWSADLTKIRSFLVDYERLMAHWHEVLPGRIIDVHYEDVVEDLEGTVRPLVERIGLEWSPRCLDFHENERMVATASVMQVRNKLYRSSVGKWRQYETLLAPHLEVLERLPSLQQQHETTP